MTIIDATHFTVDLPTATVNDTYKYCSGYYWGFVELKSDGTALPNRTYNTNDEVARWRIVYDPVIAIHDITYTVTVPVGTKICYIAGDMNNWSPQAMTKVNNTHYSITLPSYPNFLYKYLSGPDWAYQELDNNNNTIADRTYLEADIVANWQSVYDPPTITSFTPTSGGIGTTITITGTNLSGTTSVNIGGTAASSFTVDNGTSVSAIVGTGATGTVSVTTTDGGSAVSAGTFTFITSIASTAGGLSTALTGGGYDLATITNLTITGTIDARDFKTMRDNMPLLAYLDLSGANIVAYNGALGTNLDQLNYLSNEIPSKSFMGKSSLINVILPNSTNFINSQAFYECSNITSITIPNSVTLFGDNVFYNCTSLININLPTSLTVISNSLFMGCSSLKNITIPASVTKIENGAFSSCSSLESIVIPNSVTEINNNVFSDCTALINIELPNNLTEISSSLFDNCSSLSTITIPNSVVTINSEAFNKCSLLTDIRLGNSLKTIKNYAFQECTSLETITIPSSVNSIELLAFIFCNNLTSFNVELNNLYYSSSDGVLFNKDQSKLIRFPEGKAGGYTIPNTVSSIGMYAFALATKLTSISIPSSVSIFESQPHYMADNELCTLTFIGCSSLTSIYAYRSVPVVLDLFTFSSFDLNACTLYVPLGQVADYEAASQWTDFNIVEMGSTTIVEDDNTNNITLNPAIDIVVNDGVRFTVNADKEVHNITVLPGGTIDLSKQLTANGDVTLKADDNKSFAAKIDYNNDNLGKISTIGSVRYVKTMLRDHWYFISFPCNVEQVNITKADGTSLGTFGEGLDWDVEYYDGAARAVNKQTDSRNWKTIGSGTPLEAFKGYIFWVNGAGTVDVAFKLNKTLVESEAEKAIPVLQCGSSNTIHDGWNLIGQPYLSKYAGGNAAVTYMTFPNSDGGLTYTTVHKSENENKGRIVDPFTAYFVQVAADGTIPFYTSGRQAAPASVAAEVSDILQLNFTTPTGTDNTNLVMDNDQSTSYKIGEDMVKWLGTGTAKPQVYTIIGGVNYAYNGLPITSVVNLPLGIYTQTAGTSTISVDATSAPSLSQLLLTDKTTGTVTNLLTSSYSFNASAGTNNTRFTITAQRISTESTIENETDGPTVLINNLELIINNLNGKTNVRVFDAIGRMVVSKTTNNSSIEIPLSAQGIYTVQMESGAKSWVRKVVISR